MLFIVSRDGDEVNFDMQDDFGHALAASINLIRAGYVQYTSYCEFMNDDADPAKRMLLVEGKVLRLGA